ncbi:Rho GTPase activation protein, partial [Mollisia scopiformis]
IFGVALRESICYANVMITAVNNEGEKFVIGYVPIVVAKICVLLKEKGTESEDIFARSGSANRVHQLEIIFDTPDRYGKGLDWSGYSVHDAATCLLRYLKRLPEPVISFEFYNRFTSIDFDAGIEEEAINAFKDCSTDLQPMPRMLLMYIIDLVQVFASKSKTNKMTTARLVAAFQPSLLAKDPSVGMSAYDHQRAADTITFLVENDFSSILLIAKTETKTDGGEDDIALATEGEGEEQEEA